jgi:hypothetical protein
MNELPFASEIHDYLRIETDRPWKEGDPSKRFVGDFQWNWIPWCHCNSILFFPFQLAWSLEEEETLHTARTPRRSFSIIETLFECTCCIWTVHQKWRGRTTNYYFKIINICIMYRMALPKIMAKYTLRITEH